MQIPPATLRRGARLVAVVSAIAFVACIVQMARRLAAENHAAARPFFAFMPVDARRFSFAGREVRLDDALQPPAPHVLVRYADTELRLDVTLPIRFPGLPGLASHADWLKVLRFADSTGRTFDQLQHAIETGEVRDRLVIVTRSPPPGADPATWGGVWKNQWSFDFYEFLPDATISREHLGYPTYRLGQQPKPGELREGTWQYDAALHLMPKQGPTYRFTASPLAAAGWTLPAASLAAVVLLAAVVIGVNPRRAR